jgi:hypothetical protein
MNKDNLIEFAKEQCEIFPEDSYMGEYLRKTIKMLQADEAKAIPLERLKDFRNEVMNMNSIAIIQRLDKLIEEVEDAK